MLKETKSLRLAAAAIAVAVFGFASAASADAGHSHGNVHGKPGNAAKVSRTINVTLRDNVFEPNEIAVKAGETIRFVIANKGELIHEFNIGTAEMHAAHQKEMTMMQDMGVLDGNRIDYGKMKSMDMGHGKMMKHDDPNSALLEPGKTAELVWTFPKPGKLELACNVPGHYEAGMVGRFHIR